MSGFLGEAEGWRWIEGIMAIFTGVLWILCSLTIPETYAPVLLRIRAAKLSKLTGKIYVSKLEIGKDRVTVFKRLSLSLSRPWKLLFREPIVMLVSIYMAIVYGTLYMMFAAFPIIFEVNKGWSPGFSGLAFLGILVGMVFAIGYAMWDNVRYTRIANATDGLVPAEARLPGAIVGSIFLPIGLFWFAWTDGNNVHWIVPIIGSIFFATGLVLVFLSLLNYLIDCCTSTVSPISSPPPDHPTNRNALTLQTLCLLPQSLLRMRFCAPSSAQPSRSSRPKCTATSASTGRRPSQRSSRWPASRSRSCFGNTATRSAPAASTRPRRRGSSRRCTRRTARSTRARPRRRSRTRSAIRGSSSR